MNKKDLKKFKELLLRRKQELMAAADNAKEEGIGFDTDDLPDEVDQASTEAGQSLNLRLRDREVTLIKKIDKTLIKIEDGSFGVCERCGEEIGTKRLEARPVADLCMRCKEEEERRERTFAT